MSSKGIFGLEWSADTRHSRIIRDFQKASLTRYYKEHPDEFEGLFVMMYEVIKQDKGKTLTSEHSVSFDRITLDGEQYLIDAWGRLYTLDYHKLLCPIHTRTQVKKWLISREPLIYSIGCRNCAHEDNEPIVTPLKAKHPIKPFKEQGSK